MKVGLLPVLVGLVAAVIFTACSTSSLRKQTDRKTAATPGDPSDPYLWLEEIDTPRVTDWVQSHNTQSLAVLQGDARYKGTLETLRKVIMAKDRIPYPELVRDQVYNFWQDGQIVHGIWRRSPVEAYLKKTPRWETVLDLDELSKKENQNWVWKGSDCLEPAHERCMVYLSAGGTDAVEAREFDLVRKDFVQDGFKLPQAKLNTAWLDRDTLLVNTDFGGDSLTTSGYARIVKVWKRGTPLSQATQIIESAKTDVGVHATAYHGPDQSYFFVSQDLTFYSSKKFLLKPDLTLKELPFPESSIFLGYFKGQALLQLRDPWTLNGATLPAGAIVSVPWASIDVNASASEPMTAEVVYVPDARSSYQELTMTRGSLYINTLQNVQGKVLKVTRVGTSWQSESLDLPTGGVTALVASDERSDLLLVTYLGFLQTTTYYAVRDASTAVHPFWSGTSRFDSSGLTVDQFESVSADGTHIPYFVVHNKNIKMDGSTPTLLYGYGGFEVSMTPWYLSTFGKTWLEKGGTFVLANIRGGGEFGPAWHQAAILQNRQKVFDDFVSVAEDLIAKKFTSPRRLGIEGGSNGGLLVGGTYIQRPELFNAVLCEVPLLDMLRYTVMKYKDKPAAGSSWIGEYGDPQDPVMRPIIERYSPYQNVSPAARYPEVFFMAANDDRVHPGHARKTAARMEEQGHPFLFYESAEGGHEGSADLENTAIEDTLRLVYLYRKLVD
jgi:prolyl oligopeptidase